MRAIEFFCGIGGFAAAVAGSNVEVVAALDQSDAALAVYRRNFQGEALWKTDLERLTVAELARHPAELWWLSPPCQPYSVRGRRQDLADPRARSLARILDLLDKLPGDALPRHLALENVPGFAGSSACDRLRGVLARRNFEFRERLLCPTELGVPSRRPRYYLVASRTALGAPRPLPPKRLEPLAPYLLPGLSAITPAALKVPPEVVARFGNGFRLLDPHLEGSYTTCFTAGYGKSLMHAGSYLKTPTGVRRFAPLEIARLLHFPENFAFPESMPIRNQWHLVGNSLSVVAVREVLRDLPEILLPGTTFCR